MSPGVIGLGGIDVKDDREFILRVGDEKPCLRPVDLLYKEDDFAGVGLIKKIVKFLIECLIGEGVIEMFDSKLSLNVHSEKVVEAYNRINRLEGIDMISLREIWDVYQGASQVTADRSEYLKLHLPHLADFARRVVKGCVTKKVFSKGEVVVLIAQVENVCIQNLR